MTTIRERLQSGVEPIGLPETAAGNIRVLEELGNVHGASWPVEELRRFFLSFQYYYVIPHHQRPGLVMGAVKELALLSGKESLQKSYRLPKLLEQKFSNHEPPNILTEEEWVELWEKQNNCAAFIENGVCYLSDRTQHHQIRSFLNYVMTRNLQDDCIIDGALAFDYCDSVNWEVDARLVVPALEQIFKLRPNQELDSKVAGFIKGAKLSSKDFTRVRPASTEELQQLRLCLTKDFTSQMELITDLSKQFGQKYVLELMKILAREISPRSYLIMTLLGDVQLYFEPLQHLHVICVAFIELLQKKNPDRPGIWDESWVKNMLDLRNQSFSPGTLQGLYAQGSVGF